MRALTWAMKPASAGSTSCGWSRAATSVPMTPGCAVRPDWPEAGGRADLDGLDPQHVLAGHVLRCNAERVKCSLRIAHQRRVHGGFALQHDPDGKQASFGLDDGRVEQECNATHNGRLVSRPRHIDHQAPPAQRVQRVMRHRGNTTALDADKGGAFAALLADVAALQVAWEHDPWIAGKFGALVHVAECPIIVTFRPQLGLGAGA